MTIGNPGTARLVEACNAFHEVFTRYLRGCTAIAKLEARGIGLPETEKVHRWSSRQWQDALCRVSRIRADAPLGALAKGGVLRSYLAECPIDDPYSRELMNSILADLDHLFG